MDGYASLMYKVEYCHVLDQELTLRVVYFEEVGVVVEVGIEVGVDLTA